MASWLRENRPSVNANVCANAVYGILFHVVYSIVFFAPFSALTAFTNGGNFATAGGDIETTPTRIALIVLDQLLAFGFTVNQVIKLFKADQYWYDIFSEAISNHNEEKAEGKIIEITEVNTNTKINSTLSNQTPASNVYSNGNPHAFHQPAASVIPNEVEELSDDEDENTTSGLGNN